MSRRHDPEEADAALLERARSGQPEALATLYGAFSGDLFRVARRVTGSRESAEDILHDLFVGLPLLLTRYTDDRRLGAWLSKVTIRLALMRLRREGSQRESPLEDAAQSSSPPSNTIDRIDLTRAINLLPDSLRTVFVLRHLEGLTHDEIAALTGISPGASRVRHARAVERLRILLGPDR
jgi:RNA polymerase sigma-70 factor (ECF subfamily)